MFAWMNFHLKQPTDICFFFNLLEFSMLNFILHKGSIHSKVFNQHSLADLYNYPIGSILEISFLLSYSISTYCIISIDSMVSSDSISPLFPQTIREI